MISNLSKPEEKKEFINLLEEIKNSLREKNVGKLKSKSKELSDILGGFYEKKMSEIIFSKPIIDSPLYVLLEYYEPRNEPLFYLNSFFKYIFNLNNGLDDKGSIYYEILFGNKLIPFFKSYPKQ